MIPPQISIGPLTFHFYGTIIALSIFFGWLLAKKRARLYKIPRKLLDDPILILPLLLAIIGARIYHIADFWGYYSNNPNQIFAIWKGGLGIFGALAGALLGFWIIAKVKKIDIWRILDLVAPSLLLGQAFGRIANFINQEGFGSPTKLPWAVYINPEHRPSEYLNLSHFHPTFFYEAIIDLIFLVILLFISKKLKMKGQVFALYLVFYSIGRFIIEFWRIDTWTIGVIKVTQILTIVTLLIGIILFSIPRRPIDN
jgi:phosphatidylglycerol:prolipoprotein diacylglycerol transferase